MRPSPDRARQATQDMMDQAMDEYLKKGGEITIYGPDVYKREGYKLSKKEMAAAFANQAAIQRNIRREKDGNKNKI